MLLGILLAFLILVCIALGGVVLLQRSEGGALGMGGGPSGFLTTRGAGDLLTRTTWILAGVFFTLCLGLTILQGRMHKGASVVERLRIDPLAASARPTVPTAPQPGRRPPPRPCRTVSGRRCPKCTPRPRALRPPRRLPPPRAEDKLTESVARALARALG